MFFGRGKGGKYLTAIDVTAPGMFTELTLGNTIVGPIVLWSRGNPDTYNGQLQGQPGATFNYDQGNYDAYRKLGETWSVPAVAYVNRELLRPDDPTKRATATTRKPTGTDFVLYMGSGYGNPGEGTTFYSLDSLTGDVITHVDVDQVVAASYPELTRSGMAYANAIVANPIVFNVSRYIYAPGGVPSPNVASTPAARIYVADLYGRLWKFLTSAPDIAIPAADLGADQPVATAAAALGLPPNDPHAKPYVFVTSGNDNRAAGTFHNFGFQDDGDDTTTAVSPPEPQNGIQVYPPMKSNFVIDFEPGFRGTVQPSAAYSETDTQVFIGGRVFFAGTRFNAPNTPYAPVVPPYPCRSSFDSIIYPLGAESGQSAYDLSTGNDYVIFQDSKIAALSTQAAPAGALLAKDEGLSKVGQPIVPPPAMGLAPTTQSTSNVIPIAGPGLPQPTVRFGRRSASRTPASFSARAGSGPKPLSFRDLGVIQAKASATSARPASRNRPATCVRCGESLRSRNRRGCPEGEGSAPPDLSSLYLVIMIAVVAGTLALACRDLASQPAPPAATPGVFSFGGPPSPGPSLSPASEPVDTDAEAARRLMAEGNATEAIPLL
jgi:hypothetical protein